MKLSISLFPIVIVVLLCFFFWKMQSHSFIRTNNNHQHFCKLDQVLYDCVFSQSPIVSKACDRVNWHVNRLCHHHSCLPWSVVHMFSCELHQTDALVRQMTMIKDAGWVCFVPQEPSKLNDTYLYAKCMYIFKLPLQVRTTSGGKNMIFIMGQHQLHLTQEHSKKF